jgi:hypothetical protein
MKKISKTNGTKKVSSVINKKDIIKSKDKKIDEDFPGYPHSPSQYKMTTPLTEGGKTSKHETDESISDGSANAFEGTERMWDDE